MPAHIHLHGRALPSGGRSRRSKLQRRSGTGETNRVLQPRVPDVAPRASDVAGHVHDEAAAHYPAARCCCWLRRLRRAGALHPGERIMGERMGVAISEAQQPALRSPSGPSTCWSRRCACRAKGEGSKRLTERRSNKPGSQSSGGSQSGHSEIYE
eukprot:SAG31_NODE_1920_length_6919_cov_7.423754_6_plen_155_part_00